ncbi:hypothetical protein GF351_03910 [Candidatus Woesearchaeota archaeon]|nr:hypothetical protein [Candidatus Woesearchaeota archaeon]
MSARQRKGSNRAVGTTSSDLKLPLSVLRDRSVSVLEAIVGYLKDEKGLTYHEIAVMLNRDDRTIWTVFSRVKKKRRSRKNKRGVFDDEKKQPR